MRLEREGRTVAGELAVVGDGGDAADYDRGLVMELIGALGLPDEAPDAEPSTLRAAMIRAPRACHALSQNHGLTVKCLVTFGGQGSVPSVVMGIANLLWEWAASWSLFRVVP